MLPTAKRTERPGYIQASLQGLLALLLLCLCARAQAISGPPRVLVLSSYHPQYAWSRGQIDGIRQRLADQIPQENLFIEYLDGRHFVDDNLYRQHLYDLLRYKYQTRFDPDLVMVNDDYALEFILMHGQALFGSVPVVFSGINSDFSERLKTYPQITGVYEGMEIAGNLALIRQLQPDVQRIVLLADRTSLGLRMSQQARQLLPSWQQQQPQIELVIWDDFTWSGLKQRLANLTEQDAVLMLAIHQDSGGRYFSFSDDLPVLSRLSLAPIYGMWGSLMIGHGVVGGLMTDPLEHGQAAAELALGILEGTAASEIPIVPKARFTPQFDYLSLMRHGIPPERLPAGSRLFNEPQGFLYQYRHLVLFSLVILLLLSSTILVLSLNIRQRRHNERQLRYQAEHDPLTDLPNRRGLELALQALVREARDTGERLAVCYLDLDGFKYINDSIGHVQGDELLRAVGYRLEACMLGRGPVGRLGGDEFLLLVPANRSNDSLDGLLDGIKAEFRRPFHLDGKDYHLSGSIGISIFPDDGSDPKQLIQAADAAMFQAKKQPLHRHHFYNATITHEWTQRIRLENELREALQQDSLSLVLQPKIVLRSGELMGAEALLRWYRSDGSQLSPEQFIPVAEQSELILRLNEWVLAQVMRILRSWDDAGLGELHLAVNIAHFDDFQASLLSWAHHQQGQDRKLLQRLTLEMTESSLIKDMQQSSASLRQLRDLGMRIALDDFGTGWSNFSYFESLPIDELKIDRSFVRNSSKTHRNQKILAGLISLGKALEVVVVAEGIENDEQASLLDEYGCHWGQGYFIAPPMINEAFLEWSRHQPLAVLSPAPRGHLPHG